jgi:hypothetical protein
MELDEEEERQMAKRMVSGKMTLRDVYVQYKGVRMGSGKMTLRDVYVQYKGVRLTSE